MSGCIYAEVARGAANPSIANFYMEAARGAASLSVARFYAWVAGGAANLSSANFSVELARDVASWHPSGSKPDLSPQSPFGCSSFEEKGAPRILSPFSVRFGWWLSGV